MAPGLYCETVAAFFSNDVPKKEDLVVATVWEKIVCPLKEDLSSYANV